MAAKASPAAGGLGLPTPPLMGDVSALSPGALGFIPEGGTPPGSSLQSVMPDPKISIEVREPVGGKRPGTGGREVAGRGVTGRAGEGQSGAGQGGAGTNSFSECPDGASIIHDTSDPVLVDTTVYAFPGPVCCPHPHPGGPFLVTEDDRGFHDVAFH